MKCTKCNLCGKTFDTRPFANMNAIGELTYSKLIFNDKEYDICPKCTHKILHDHPTEKGGVQE